MSVLVIPKGAAQALRDLTGESRPDVALMLVLQDARSYRLGQVETALRAYEEKFGMTFDDYRRHWETEDSDEDYRWDAEQDYLNWEALITQKRRLEDATGWLG